VTFFNANSSQACQLIRPTSYHRAQEAPSHAFSPSLAALRVSGGLLEFLRDADHQTLEEAFDEAVRRVTSYLNKSQQTIRRRRHLYVCSCCGMSIESWPK
jgi:hypothetical protein